MGKKSGEKGLTFGEDPFTPLSNPWRYDAMSIAQRETKFRAWDNVDMKMYYTGEEDNIHFYFDSSGIVAEKFFEREICTPEGDQYPATESEKLEHLQYMQNTGLKDKNGKEIYEGDVLKAIHRIYDNQDSIQNVHFLNGCFMFGNWNAHEYFNQHQFIEVISNIYENPELLEESK